MTPFDLYTAILLAGGSLRIDGWNETANRPYLYIEPKEVKEQFRPYLDDRAIESLMVFALVDTLTEFMNRLWSYEKQFGWRNEAIPENERYEASVFYLELRDANYRRLDTKRQEQAKEEAA